jgi:hypothetical protein
MRWVAPTPSVFVNGGAYLKLHPEFEPLSWYEACAPLCTQGARLVAAKQRLFARALRSGYRIAREPDLHVQIGGRRIGAAPVNLAAVSLPALKWPSVGQIAKAMAWAAEHRDMLALKWAELNERE